MTVIVFDGKSLVADGRCTDGSASLVSDNFIKLFRVKIKEFGGDCVIGLCGCPDAFGPFLQHIEKNGLSPFKYFSFVDEEEKRALHVRGLAVNRKGQSFEIDVDGGWCEMPSRIAIGSGEKIALHEMRKGCDATEAVIEACKSELTCGGILLKYEWKSDKFTQITP